LRPLEATAEIVTAVRENCLVVPLMALTAREVEIDDDGNYLPEPEPAFDDEVLAADLSIDRKKREEIEGVFLFADGRARFRPVTTGITGEMDIEVLDGLTDGDEVVIGPFQALRKLAEWDRIEVDKKRQASAMLVRRP
jgi:HlyD family secretion protein